MKAGVASGGGAALPGMIFNVRKWVDYTCADGEARRVRAGRLECTMQNLVDSLVQRFPQQVTSAAASALPQQPTFGRMCVRWMC